MKANTGSNLHLKNKLLYLRRTSLRLTSKGQTDFTGFCAGHLIQAPAVVNPRIVACGIYDHKLAFFEILAVYGSRSAPAVM